MKPNDGLDGLRGIVAGLALTGVVALGLMWLRMAVAADAALQAGSDDADFMQAKLVTARFYADHVMPETVSLRRKLEAGSETIMELPIAAF